VNKIESKQKQCWNVRKKRKGNGSEPRQGRTVRSKPFQACSNQTEKKQEVVVTSLFFFFKKIFRISNLDLLRLVSHLKNLSSDSCIGRKWIFKNVKKIRIGAKKNYSGGAATLGWPGTAPELRYQPEKMIGK